MTPYHSDLNSMWDKIDLRSKQDVEKEGHLWGLQYLDLLIDELVELKIKAKKENNPILYNQLRTSLMRAHEVQSELNEKLKPH
ncbi:hypothetical protein [Nitrosopumilus ureiphilus]|uniref:Uncharacterized protein n=1 Tax=Nitrosopumilus ureiphilus TaxID=1470067 RepID=A0A7D5RAY0_9ARCH|nr:hypothetical protein [Nitrosopumilus ureiphilus]QLH06864.1 hypothetical protein C5F50_07090 [Nitrosopumilus ureiphilus]